MIDISHLNIYQKEAVGHTEGPLLVLAGAGSGKTAVLTLRIANIIDNGTPPWAVLAITFTNKAAAEIRERLSRLLGQDGHDVWACTFHSACVRILKRDIEALGYPKSFTIYDTDDQKRLIKRIIKEFNLDDKRYPPPAILSHISKAKDAEVNPAEYVKDAGNDSYYKIIGECYLRYQKELKDSGALDFDDIIALTVRLFRENPEILERWQRRFSYILIDEYQDTNKLQYNLISMLAQKHRNLCVVGDDDQSIYKFRGATIENILSFETQYPEARVVRLEQNYRSTQAILEGANNIIRHNQGRKGKTLRTENTRGEEISIYRAVNENDEARFIAEAVLERVRQGGRFGDHCVLYRMNSQSNRIESTLRMSGIPYKVIGGTRFFDRAEIRDIMAYLQLIHNPHDDLRFDRIINVPARGLGAKSLEVIHALAARDQSSCFEIIKQAGKYPELSRIAGTLSRVAGIVEFLMEQLSSGITLPDFYEQVLEQTGYARMLRDKGDEESKGRLENILELKSHLSQYCEAEPEDASLGGFLDDTALFTDLETYSEGDDALVMMTMHSAKGLEFPAVFIAGAEENIFPSSRAIPHPDELEEERRLCYVAVTRAKQKLYIIAAKERMLFGATMYNPPSRFIREMGLQAEIRPAQSESAATTYIAGKAKEPSIPADRVSRSSLARPTSPVTLEALRKGDCLTHKRFGKGLVLSAEPMGGDVLLEIAFEESGTRKLLQKSAAPFLKKA
ncbi:MAG: UvrD-helicase domain-containing protein [Oscillospiraceae bacterium]|nr:UvrD-helicase domain-containing protein [Oscillospiraceae bacterium]